jgi:hypothetical protein
VITERKEKVPDLGIQPLPGSLTVGDQPELDSRGFYAAVLPEAAFDTDSSNKLREAFLEPLDELEMHFGALTRWRVVVDVDHPEAGGCTGGNMETLGPELPHGDPSGTSPVVEAGFDDASCTALQSAWIRPIDTVVFLRAIAEAFWVVREQVQEIVPCDRVGTELRGVLFPIETDVPAVPVQESVWFRVTPDAASFAAPLGFGLDACRRASSVHRCSPLSHRRARLERNSDEVTTSSEGEPFLISRAPCSPLVDWLLGWKKRVFFSLKKGCVSCPWIGCGRCVGRVWGIVVLVPRASLTRKPLFRDSLRRAQTASVRSEAIDKRHDPLAEHGSSPLPPRCRRE